MSLDAYKNFALSTLASGINSSATSLSVASGHGARFPAAPFNATIYNSTDYTDAASAYWAGAAEIVRVTAKSTDTFTITRAQEGTSAVNLNAGGKTYTIIAGLTAKFAGDIPGGETSIYQSPSVDDFIGGSNQSWVGTDVANGGYFSTFGFEEWVSGAHGVRELGITSTAGSYAHVRCNSEAGIGTGTYRQALRFYMENVPDVTNNYRFYHGGHFDGSNWSAFATALWYDKDTANWQFTAAYGSTVYRTEDTGVAIASGVWFKLEVRMEWATRTATAYINDTLVATIGSAYIPSKSPNDRFRAGFGVRNVSMASTRTFIVDKFIVANY